MVVLGIHEIDKYIYDADIVELESNWVLHVKELAMIIKEVSRRGFIHIVFYDNGKYIDMYSFYNELEPYIETLENITVFWEKNLEALIYHIILLGRTSKGYLFIVLPYNRRYLSQVENTYFYRFRKILRKTANNGWNIVIINPVKNTYSVRSVFIADVTLHIEFKNNIALIRFINKNTLKKQFYQFKHVIKRSLN